VNVTHRRLAVQFTIRVTADGDRQAAIAPFEMHVAEAKASSRAIPDLGKALASLIAQHAFARTG
jgi:hypothetical protein